MISELVGEWEADDKDISSLAMAEMKTLLAAVYQRYSTTLSPGWEGRSPAITSRFELVFDDFFSVDRVSLV
jgi:hypothetical protein